MVIRPSPEIESVMRRVWSAWHESDMAVISNLFVDSPSFLGIGSDSEEWWLGSADFLRVRQMQFEEMPDYDIDIHEVLAYEDGGFGWAGLLMTMKTAVMTSKLRTTAVLRLEGGTWRIVQWHNSLPIPNEQMFGVGLTTSLDQLLASIVEEGVEVLPVGASEGTATLMFTDIVDSSVFAERVGDQAWSRLVSRHERELRAVTTGHEGRIIKMLGDGSMIAFESARAAVRAGIAVQTSFDAGGLQLRVGIHTGEVVRTGDDLLGTTVNKAARIAAAASGGETLISSTVRDLIGSMSDIEVGRPRVVALKGLQDTHQLFPVDSARK